MKMLGWEGEARSSSVERTLCVELIQPGMEAQVSAWLSQSLVQDDAFLSVCHYLSFYWESQLRENAVLSRGLSLGTSSLLPLQGFPRHFCWRASESDLICYCYLRYLPLLILPSMAVDFKCPHSK